MSTNLTNPDELAIQTKQVLLFVRKRRRAQILYLLVLTIVSIPLGVLALLATKLGKLIPALADTPLLTWQPVAGWLPLLVLAYCVLISGVFFVVSLPFVSYTRFVLPRRYGLYKGTIRDKLGPLGKAFFLFLIQIWLFIQVIVLLMVVQPQTWWAWAGLIKFLYTVLVARFGSSVWHYPLLGKIELHRTEPLPEGDLTQRFQALREKLHISTCAIYQAKVSDRTSAAMAFFMGWGASCRIIVTDTLIRKFSPDEIEVILAHELGHLVHHDIWKRLVLNGMHFLGLFYVLYLYIVMVANNSPSAILSIQQLPVIGLYVIFIFLLRPTLRRQEYQADEFALQTTGKVQAFKDAMTRLTQTNLPLITSTRKARPGTHPLLVARLRHADEFAARSASSLPNVS